MNTFFENDIEKGKIKEFIFKNFFLGFLGISNKDVSNDSVYRSADIDIITNDFSIDVKSLTFKDSIIIEDYTNYNEKISPISKGWFYKSKANIIAFVSYDKDNSTNNNGLIILLRFDDKFKEWYEINKSKYELRVNRISKNKFGNQWQSAYRIIPFYDLEGFIASYKVKIVKNENFFDIVYPNKQLINTNNLFK